jgi:hypothetical protein
MKAAGERWKSEAKCVRKLGTMKSNASGSSSRSFAGAPVPRKSSRSTRGGASAVRRERCRLSDLDKLSVRVPKVAADLLIVSRPVSPVDYESSIREPENARLTDPAFPFGTLYGVIRDRGFDASPRAAGGQTVPSCGQRLSAQYCSHSRTQRN